MARRNQLADKGGKLLGERQDDDDADNVERRMKSYQRYLCIVFDDVRAASE